jgi:DNA-binding response OmpR family regulator
MFYEIPGYPVKSVDTAQGGIDALELDDYEAIICERHLPDMDGLEFFRMIEGSHPSAMKVLIVNDYRGDNLIGLANETGVHDFIEKPFTGWNLEEILVKRTDRCGIETRGC